MSTLAASITETLDRPRPWFRRSSWPRYEDDEIAAASAVLRSGRVNALVHGEQNRLFEQEFARFCGAPHAIAVANGTLALELALRALGIGPGDEVIVPARSFFASVSCVVAVGATPVFVDICPLSHTIDPEDAEAMITPATRAIIAVHLAGWPCDMDALMQLCTKRGLFLVEDCAQAHGATYRGRRVGAIGDAGAFSFCTDKIMSTCGEGGMLLLRKTDHWRRAWTYKDHGKDPLKMALPAAGAGFRFLHDSFGSNFRLTEFQAAVGRVQLAKLPRWLNRRRRNAAALHAALADHPLVRFPPVPDHVEHARYKAVFELARRRPRLDRDALLARLIAEGVPASSGSCPDMSCEAAFGCGVRRALPAAAAVGTQTIMLPTDHTLDEDDMRAMAAVVRAVLDDHPAADEGE